jgi:hypothetical protein
MRPMWSSPSRQFPVPVTERAKLRPADKGGHSGLIRRAKFAGAATLRLLQRDLREVVGRYLSMTSNVRRRQLLERTPFEWASTRCMTIDGLVAIGLHNVTRSL